MSKNRVGEAISPDYKALGDKLTSIRNSLDLSQAEAAKKIGIPQSTYSGYETGKRKITLTKLRTIAAAYGVDVDFLLGTGNAGSDLSENEQILIEIYRNDPSVKSTLERLIAYQKLLNKDASK